MSDFNPNAPARVCPGCNVVTDYADLIRVDARTVRCAECVRESVERDEECAGEVPSLGELLARAMNAEFSAKYFTHHEAQNELADRGALDESDLDAFADLCAARFPQLSAVGT